MGQTKVKMLARIMRQLFANQPVEIADQQKVNVSHRHGDHKTYEAGDGTWWNSPIGGQQVVYTDYSSGRGQNGAATAAVWGEHAQQQKRRGLDPYVINNPQLGELEGIKRAATQFPNSEIRTDSDDACRRFTLQNLFSDCTITVVRGHNNDNVGHQRADHLARNGF